MISSLVSLILFYVSIWPVVFRFMDQHIIPFLIGIGSTLFLFLYFLCHQLGMMDWFETLLSKVGFALGGRALSLLMIKGGCPISVTLAIGFLVRGIFNSESAPFLGNCMDTDSGPSTSFPKLEGERVLELEKNEKAPSALEERENELIHENLTRRKGDGQKISEVRQAVESDFHVESQADKFVLIQKMEEESGAQKEDCPVTKSTFNEIKDYKSHIQDEKKRI